MQEAVSNIFARKSEKFVKLHLAGDSVVCTPEHPFFVNNTWREAKDLKAGDSLFVYSGYKVALDGIFAFRTDTAVAVYNLEASGNHNYYVSASKVLVHNCDKSITNSTDDIVEGLVKLNKGKNSVTIKTNSGHIRYDLKGATHGNVPTPHYQIYIKNFKPDGSVGSISRQSKIAIPMKNKDYRIIKKYLRKK